MNVNKININQSEQSYYIASDIYDVSYHNSGTTFDSLSELLNSENLSILIPSEIRCGGMTIRFIQSSDNKYVQYRLMSNEFTKDIAQWAIDDESVYTENPEFIYVKTDADDRLLWWIYADGSIDWAKGVPTPIQEELKKLEQLIKVNTEGAESIVSRVSANEASIAAINEDMVEVAEALNKKADGEYEESLEYVRLNKDADERILNGIKSDGTNYMPKAEIDTLLLDGNQVDNDSVVAHKYIESPEFIRYYCDADGRLIWWIYQDGGVDWANGVPQPIQVELRKLEQLISEGDSSISEQI